MRDTTSSVQATAKAAGLTATLVLGLIFGLAPTPASAHSVGYPAAIAGQHGDEATCDQAEAAAEAAAADAVRQLEVAFRADRRAIETLKATVGEDNKAARDLLRKAAADLERIFAKAKAALDVDDEDEDDTACATPDLTAFDGIVATATTDMTNVVADVTAAVAALPAGQAKKDHDDEDDD